MLRLLLLCIGLALLLSNAVLAHANLVKSDPSPNEVLSRAPSEIRLWFSEPLEPAFSHITLRDSNGNIIETNDATVDPTDTRQLALAMGNLPNGVYTISWRVVSAADGHQTQGSIPFSIGVASAFPATDVTESIIPIDGAIIRWFNLVGLSLGVGSIGFIHFVWIPSIPTGHGRIEKRLYVVMWCGWALMGVGAIGMLFLQTSILGGTPLLDALNSSAIEEIFNTRFGSLWLARLILWVMLAQLLLWARAYTPIYPVALLFGLGILGTQSLFSHASASPIPVASILGDFVHFSAAALWFGGLVAFLVAIYSVKRFITYPAPLAVQLVGRFSSLGRGCVALLIISGLYAGWLQVGSLEGLFTTRYGQILLLKMLLIVPLLAIAGYNLFFTARGLKSGDERWLTRLRGAMSAEIALLIGVLMSVGALTAAQPARGVLEARAMQNNVANTYFDSIFEDDFHTDFEIIPAQPGENTFRLTLYGHEGEPIEDATRIRLRFDYLDDNIGTSELRAEHIGGGIYVAKGTNLSAAGQWRVRVTIQRPEHFDTVIDFTPTIAIPTTNELTAQPTQALIGAQPIILLSGLAILSIGGYLLGKSARHWLNSSRWIGLGLCIIGIVFLWHGVDMYLQETSADSVDSEQIRFAPKAPIRVRFAPDNQRPYVITTDGALYQPRTEKWQLRDVGAIVRDVYIDAQGSIWAATDEGLLYSEGDTWTTLDTTPITTLEMTHGYIFSLGNTIIPRITRGIHDEKYRLDTPDPSKTAQRLVMLGNHTHVLQNGDALFLTRDLGLGWEALSAPEPIQSITTDSNGHLIAIGTHQFYIQRYDRLGKWLGPYPLPASATTEVISFKEHLYALAQGRLYQREGGQWLDISPAPTGTILIGLRSQYISADEQYLWVIAPQESQFWRSKDGQRWETLHFAPID